MTFVICTWPLVVVWPCEMAYSSPRYLLCSHYSHNRPTARISRPIRDGESSARALKKQKKNQNKAILQLVSALCSQRRRSYRRGPWPAQRLRENGGLDRASVHSSRPARVIPRSLSGRRAVHPLASLQAYTRQSREITTTSC